MKGESLLITGGAGFVGVNLVNKLAGGRSIRVLDSLVRSSPTGRSEENCEYLVGDVRDSNVMTKALAGVREVVHLAAFGSVVESVANPMDNFRENVNGTMSVLHAAQQASVKRLVFASTGGALIGNATPPVDENSLPKPISPYGASKLCGEAYCNAFAESYGMETVALRFGNVYGPHSAHKRGAITMFMKALLRDEPIVIYGDGSASRDYIHVSDLTDGIKLALESDIGEAEVFHLSSGIETSVLELAELIKDVAGKPNHPIEFRSVRKGEVLRNFASFEKASRKLGYRPNIILREGIAETWDWFRSQEDSVLSATMTDS